MTFSEIDLIRIEENSARLAPILPLLQEKDSLWHRTSVKNLGSILEQGIQPNLGDIKTTYPQSKNCLGFHLKGVCLFDFETFELEHILCSASDWASLLTDRGAATVLIRINREKLDSNVLVLPGTLTHYEMLIPDQPGQPAYIPTHFYAVEAWHKGTITPEAFAEIVLIRQNSNYEFVRVPLSTTTYQVITDLSDQWEMHANNEKKLRRLHGEFSAIDLLENL